MQLLQYHWRNLQSSNFLVQREIEVTIYQLSFGATNCASCAIQNLSVAWQKTCPLASSKLYELQRVGPSHFQKTPKCMGKTSSISNYFQVTLWDSANQKVLTVQAISSSPAFFGTPRKFSGNFSGAVRKADMDQYLFIFLSCLIQGAV